MLDVYIYEPFAQDSEKQIRRHFIKRECFVLFCFVFSFLFLLCFLFVCLFVFSSLWGDSHAQISHKFIHVCETEEI